MEYYLASVQWRTPFGLKRSDVYLVYPRGAYVADAVHGHKAARKALSAAVGYVTRLEVLERAERAYGWTVDLSFIFER